MGSKFMIGYGAMEKSKAFYGDEKIRGLQNIGRRLQEDYGVGL